MNTKSSHNFHLISKILFGIYICIQFSSCTNDQVDNNLSEAYIRVINATPENYICSVFVNDSLKTPQGLNFTESIAYTPISAGQHILVSKISNSEIKNSKLNFLFKPAKYYSLFISGKISKDSMLYIALEDNLEAPSSNKAKVRFINTCLNSPALDAIFSTNQTDSIANISNLTYRSSSNYSAYVPGNYTLKIKDRNKKTTLLTNTNLTITKGKIYTIWIKGLLNNTGTYAFSVATLEDL
jgi:hypothetical protein